MHVFSIFIENRQISNISILDVGERNVVIQYSHHYRKALLSRNDLSTVPAIHFKKLIVVEHLTPQIMNRPIRF